VHAPYAALFLKRPVSLIVPVSHLPVIQPDPDVMFGERLHDAVNILGELPVLLPGHADSVAASVRAVPDGEEEASRRLRHLLGLGAGRNLLDLIETGMSDAGAYPEAVRRGAGLLLSSVRRGKESKAHPRDECYSHPILRSSNRKG